jgi:hypothetical protein
MMCFNNMTIIWDIIHHLFSFFNNKVWETGYSSIIRFKGGKVPVQLGL